MGSKTAVTTASEPGMVKVLLAMAAWALCHSLNCQPSAGSGMRVMTVPLGTAQRFRMDRPMTLSSGQVKRRIPWPETAVVRERRLRSSAVLAWTKKPSSPWLLVPSQLRVRVIRSPGWYWVSVSSPRYQWEKRWGSYSPLNSPASSAVGRANGWSIFP